MYDIVELVMEEYLSIFSTFNKTSILCLGKNDPASCNTVNALKAKENI